MTTARDRAEGLLIHYMRTVWKAAGLTWNSDNIAEMEALVDALVELVNDAVREHAEQAPHLYPDGSTS